MTLTDELLRDVPPELASALRLGHGPDSGLVLILRHVREGETLELSRPAGWPLDHHEVDVLSAILLDYPPDCREMVCGLVSLAIADALKLPLAEVDESRPARLARRGEDVMTPDETSDLARRLLDLLEPALRPDQVAAVRLGLPMHVRVVRRRGRRIVTVVGEGWSRVIMDEPLRATDPFGNVSGPKISTGDLLAAARLLSWTCRAVDGLD